MRAFGVAAMVALFVSSPGPALCDTQFDVGEWAAGDWIVVVQDLPAGSGNGSVSFDASGGNPGSNVRHNYSHGSPGFLTGSFVTYTYTTAYDPAASGAIEELDISIDARRTDGLSPFTYLRFFVSQSSFADFGPTFEVTSGPWATFAAAGLTAADFPAIDFSATGGPITFGFSTGLYCDGCSPGGREIRADNFSVRVTSDPTSVSDPLVVQGWSRTKAAHR